jgi:hypothetical protein
LQVLASFRVVVPIVVLVLSAGAAACTSAGGLPSAAPSTASAAPATPSPITGTTSPEPSESPEPSAVEPSSPAPISPIPSGATQIDWGVIWDSLPPSFPHYPGAQPTQTGGGPASAILDLPADAPTASAWFQAALKQAGFTIVGANGPREDGSFDVLAARGDVCRTEISLAPLGTTTTATIYVSAGCPFS